MAASRPARAALALAAVSTPMVSIPRVVAVTSCMASATVSPALMPTWMLTVATVPSRIWTPLKEVWSAIRSTSEIRAWNSVSMTARSVSVTVPLADWTASSRIRVRMLLTSCSAPSAVWVRLTPSWALRWVTAKERI